MRLVISMFLLASCGGAPAPKAPAAPAPAAPAPAAPSGGYQEVKAMPADFPFAPPLDFHFDSAIHTDGQVGWQLVGLTEGKTDIVVATYKGWMKGLGATARATQSGDQAEIVGQNAGYTLKVSLIGSDTTITVQPKP